MKKIIKRVAIGLAVAVGIVFVNGCIYVFCCQDTSMEKVRQGKALNVYECCSVYTMHMALWLFGWPLSPEAAWECFLLHFPHEEDEVVEFRARRKFCTPKLKRAINSLADKPYGSSVTVAWNGDRDYALNSPERRAAIAVNACMVTKCRPADEVAAQGHYEASITCPMLYPEYSRTHFNLGKVSIMVHEGLFRHLQDRGWLSRYVADYRTANWWVARSGR